MLLAPLISPRKLVAVQLPIVLIHMVRSPGVQLLQTLLILQLELARCGAEFCPLRSQWL